MKLNFEWREDKAQYSNGESLYLNRICVGGFSWNMAQSRDSKDPEKDYSGKTYLLGLTKQTVFGKDKESIRPKIEALVNKWFEEATK